MKRVTEDRIRHAVEALTDWLRELEEAADDDAPTDETDSNTGLVEDGREARPAPSSFTLPVSLAKADQEKRNARER